MSAVSEYDVVFVVPGLYTMPVGKSLAVSRGNSVSCTQVEHYPSGERSGGLQGEEC